MKIKEYLCLFFILSFVNADGQQRLTLEFSKENWNIKPSKYYISEVLDERENKSDAGKALSGNKITTIVFKNSLESDLLQLINSSTEQDTSKVPLVIAFDKLVLNETGTSSNHKATVDFSLKFYRVINEKKYKIFETNGKPHLEMRGPYQNPHEKIIREILKSTLKNFDTWINQHPDLQPLAKTVVVSFKKREGGISGDTIFWNDKYKLKWSDFKGKPDASPYMALSNCAFYYRANPIVNNGVMDLQISLDANFDKNSSWVKPNVNSDTLLAHEQLHFDICELYIRKLKKRILENEYNPMEFDARIKILFDEIWKEYMLQQQKYDEETLHGIVSIQQQKWQMDITEQLNKISSMGSLIE